MRKKGAENKKDLSLFQAFIANGFNVVLSFDTFSHSFHPERRQVDFEKDPGKVSVFRRKAGRGLSSGGSLAGKGHMRQRQYA